MRVIVFGGDGFCGWPTALRLSNAGHDVMVVDNLSRRQIDLKNGWNSLTPIKSLPERVDAFKRETGREIETQVINVAEEYHELRDLMKSFKPEAVVHFAEQRSAPYSMKNSGLNRYTVFNNIVGTNNILAAIVECELSVHLVHLGTMGVYGYNTINAKIPEGYLDVAVKTLDGSSVNREILYPTDPGSIYHMTKSQDQLLFYFYNKNYKIRITDLHQGIVWGTQTEETSLHPDLSNRFDYDGDYGTVLNRFLVQAVVDFPLTVYGKGGQTRAFINIQDTVRCVQLAIENPSNDNRVRIFNQMTETFSVMQLAELISEKYGAKIQAIENPRKENEENDLMVANDHFLDLGLKPITLDGGLLGEITDVVHKHADRVDKNIIMPSSFW